VRSSPTRWLLVLTVLLGAASGYGFSRSIALEESASAKTVPIRRAGEAFAATLDGAHQDAELALLDEKRQLLLGASDWRRGATLLAVLAVLGLFGSLIARELTAFRDTVDVEDEVPPGKPQAR